jgi:hypothetical protein
LIVKPKRHVVFMGDLLDDEAEELGPLLRATAAVVGELTDAAQVYTCLWSHGPVHLHFVVQPALDDVIETYGLSGPRMQAAMFVRGEIVDAHDAAAFADRARDAFLAR